MPNQAEIITAIAEILGLEPGDIDRGALLLDDLNLTPLEVNDLISQLQAKFRIILNPEDISSVKSVDDLIIAVEDNLI